jgi:hypothetical protein
MQAYPTDGVAIALSNVFDFDRATPLEAKILADTLAKHGISIILARESPALRVRLAEPGPLPPAVPMEEWKWGADKTMAVPVRQEGEAPVRMNQLTKSSRWQLPDPEQHLLQWRDMRAQVFTEMHASLDLRPAMPKGQVMGTTVLHDGSLAVVFLTASDLMLCHVRDCTPPVSQGGMKHAEGQETTQLASSPSPCECFSLVKGVPPYSLTIKPRQLVMFAVGPSTLVSKCLLLN